MKIVDEYLLNFILVTGPVITYLLYIAYTKTINKKEEKLVFLIMIASEFYFMLKYGQSQKFIPLLIVDVPLIISFYKKNTTTIIISTLISVLYFYTYYENHLLIITSEYLIYYIISANKKHTYTSLLTFSLIKLIFISYYQNISAPLIINMIITHIIFVFIIYLIIKTEEMLKLHKHLKEISKQSDVQSAIFKISHEIKNPIAVCKGYLDMYDENNIESAKKYISIIKEEVNRTLVLLEDFSALSKLKINEELIDINLLLESVIKNMQLLLASNKIKLIKNITDEEIYISADYNRLMQVFINIIKNSIEALETKENAQIKIWTEFTKDKIIIKIKDNGVGIKKELLNKVKEPFFTTKSKGSGLGISLSNEIIKAHKGELNYISKENQYTLVEVILPLEKAI